MGTKRKTGTTTNFARLSQADVPQGRKGKHKSIVTKILADLEQVPEGIAIKVPLAELAESKEKVRSAVNRACHKAGISVVTASDDRYLYLWNEPEND